MKITGRATFGWGASSAPPASPTKGLVIHYDGSNQGLAERPHTACITYWKNTRRFHMGASRGWRDIGYSFGACPHGEIFEGRGLGREQAAQPGGNTTWYSVTLMSGPGEDLTSAQIDAVRRLRAWLMAKGVGGQVKGHRDFISTSCPGDRAYRLVQDGVFSKKPIKEDDVSAADVWKHEIPVPWGSAENPEWQAKSLLVEANKRIRNVEALLQAQGVAIGQLAEALAQRDDEIDVEALVARIEQAIEGITVHLDVPDPA